LFISFFEGHFISRIRNRIHKHEFIEKEGGGLVDGSLLEKNPRINLRENPWEKKQGTMTEKCIDPSSVEQNNYYHTP
jgi:hypothetical protein